MTQGNALYTGPTAEDLAHIPDELKDRCQWVLWRGADKIDKKNGEVRLNKVPIDPQTMRHASTTDPTTWGTFEQCVAALPVALEEWEQENPSAYRGGGIGYVFSHEDPYAGVDLDHCRDPDTGVLADWAQAYLAALASYSEVSPSQTGVKVWVKGTLPARGRKKRLLETYDRSRFFTMTGWHVPGTPHTIEARQDALITFYTAMVGEAQPPHQHGPIPHTARTPLLEDTALLDKARQAKNRAQFAALWDGDTTAYPSQSEADLGLCMRLAFWTQDAAQIDRLFRQSGLMRDKWDEQHGAQTYGERTIAEALTRQTEHYKPRQRRAQDARRRRNGQTPDEDRPTEDLQDPRPVVRIGPDITRMVDEGQAALLALPDGPVLFQRARRLSIIARGVKPPRWLHRPADAPVIIEAQAPYLDELATKAARWEKFDKRDEEWYEVTPPARFVKTLQARPSWPFPLLEGIIHSPTLRPDGSILDHPGYDPDTGLFFDSNGTTFPAIPQRPTLDQARSAIAQLQEVVCNFPFAEPWHFSAWLSAVLSVVCRYTILGCVPMHGITATAPGSGKSLLSDTIALIGTGHTAARWSQVTEEEEERKRLFTLALAGDQLIVIDNITAPLGSGALANVLTATSLKERILGTLEEKEAPMTAVFLCTGNNVQYVNDVARRVLPIALDPKMERPEERTGFLHPDLPAWVQSERPRLTIAALTIVKAYFTAGCPSQGISPLGSFEAWSDLIRQALVWAGEADPNEGRKDIEAASNPEVEALAVVLHAWKACYPLESKTLQEVLKDIDHKSQHVGPETTANEWNDLQDALGACDRKYDGKKLRSEPISYALRKWQGRIIDGMRFAIAGKGHANKTLWQVQQL